MLVERELFDILRGFASLQPTQLLGWPLHLSLQRTHDFLLNSVLSSPHFESYPPSSQYQERFWKWAIGNLERTLSTTFAEDGNDFEIDSRIYDRYLELLPRSGPTIGSPDAGNRNQVCGRGLAFSQLPPSESFVTHYWQPRPQGNASTDKLADGPLIHVSRYETVTLLESRRMVENGTTGLRTWFASFLLAQYLIQNPGLIAQQRVLELGSGIGFLGTIVSALQSHHATWNGDTDSYGAIYLTDVKDEVLARCQDNVRLACNSCSTHSHVYVRSLDWSASLDADRRETLSSLLQNEIDPTVILGADIIFDPSLTPALVGTLQLAILGRNGTRGICALIALTIRNEATVDAFLVQLQGAALKVIEIPVEFNKSIFLEWTHEPLGQENVKLFKITA